MKYVFSFIILIILSSCSFILKRTYGIKDPAFESVSSIDQYARTIGIDPSQLVFAKDSSAQTSLNNLFHGNPEILIFDKNKEFHPYKSDTLSCNASIENILTNICSITKNSSRTKRKVSYDLLVNSIFDPHQCLKTDDLEEFDFIVFFNFAKYSYGLNKSHIIPWTQVIKKPDPECKVKYVFVDLDYLNTWGLIKKDLPKFKIKL